jgi:hypothetical protein
MYEKSSPTGKRLEGSTNFVMLIHADYVELTASQQARVPIEKKTAGIVAFRGDIYDKWTGGIAQVAGDVNRYTGKTSIMAYDPKERDQALINRTGVQMYWLIEAGCITAKQMF